MKIYAASLLSILTGTVAFVPNIQKSSAPTSLSIIGTNFLGRGRYGYDRGYGSGYDTMNPYRNRGGYIEPYGRGGYGNIDGPMGFVDRSIPLADQIWERSYPIIVQGGSLKTMSFSSPLVDRLHVAMRTEGRPLEATVELWQGPDNTPIKLKVYSEDGQVRPFSAVLETPRSPNTVAIKNEANLEFPFDAAVAANAFDDNASYELSRSRSEYSPMTIQGGALRTFPFETMVDSVQVLLETDGRPLSARVELLQGPNNNKQTVEVYCEDGLDRPFYMVIDTPGDGNVVRVVNTATVEFPMTAWVEPYRLGGRSNRDWSRNSEGGSYREPVIGGDTSASFRGRY